MGLEDCIEEAIRDYENAEINIGSTSFANPTVLGLRLNKTKFMHEVLKQKDEALLVAETTYSKAAPLIATLDGSMKQECMAILNLMKENIEMWKTLVTPTPISITPTTGSKIN